MTGTAVLSMLHTHRYELTREWPVVAGPVRLIGFVMLNPSTANADEDDPTIRRCVGFAQRLGGSGLVVVNLFGMRATDPRSLESATDPVGLRNDWYIIEAARRVDVLIAGWGALSTKRTRCRAAIVRSMVEIDARTRLWCLGRTRDGFPRHPLYLPKDAPISPWP